MKTKRFSQVTVVRALLATRLLWSAIALVLLTAPFVAQAQIQQIGLLPGLPNPTKTTVWNQNKTTIYQATGTQNTRIPFGLSIDVANGSTIVKKVLVSWGVNPDFNPDGTGALALNYNRSSTDGGITWGPVVTHATTNVTYMSAFRKWDGNMVALSYRPTEGYFTSTNNGVTWTKHTDGSTSVPTLFHRGMIEERRTTSPSDPDVYDLYAMGYVANTASNIGKAYLFKSTNGGKDWTLLSTPALGGSAGDGRIYNEPTLERCADGSWLMVVRDEGGLLRWRRSTNQGVSWLGTGTSLVTGLPTRPAPTTPLDCDPHLKLMPNGVLVLSYGTKNANEASGLSGGSRDCHIAFSADGKGNSWTNDIPTLIGQTYDPSDNNPAAGLESSGYTAAIPVSAHRFITIGDTGQSWSYSTPNPPSPNPYSIWGRYVDIVRTNQQNRIDLKTKHALGLITIMSPQTDLTYANPTHPQVRLTGAFDGSTDYWSGAFKPGTSGTYQLDLQQTYNLTGIGICLQYNTAQSATVETSPDNVTWTPRKTYTNATHNALDYTMFTSAPVRYVRVQVQSGGSGVNSRVSLNEIELYQAESTFENNAAHAMGYTGALPHGILPPGYASGGTSGTQYGFFVKDGNGYQSNRALEMWDSSSLWFAGVKKTVTATSTKQWTFRYKPVAFSGTGVNGHTFKILGTSGGAVAAYQFAIMPNGRAQYYNVAANPDTWSDIAGFPAGTIAANSWYHLRIDATLTTAQIFVNGVSKGTFPKAVAGSLTNLNGFGFGSTGTITSGDKAVYDDININ